MSKHRKSEIDQARDDLMSHIHRCGVLKAAPEHQIAWLDETMEYLAECYPALTAGELAELKQIGVRFCQPVIPHGKGHTALTMQEEAAEAPRAEEHEMKRETQEMAGV